MSWAGHEWAGDGWAGDERATEVGAPGHRTVARAAPEVGSPGSSERRATELRHEHRHPHPVDRELGMGAHRACLHRELIYVAMKRG